MGRYGIYLITYHIYILFLVTCCIQTFSKNMCELLLTSGCRRITKATKINFYLIIRMQQNILQFQMVP